MATKNAEAHAAVDWMLKNTRHGRNTYAIGGNRDAAVNAGIQASRHVIINFAIAGWFMICRVISPSRSNS